MTKKEAYDLLVSVRADYVAMVRELNRVKRLVHPVNPWTMPQVRRMSNGIDDLRLAAGIPEPK